MGMLFHATCFIRIQFSSGYAIPCTCFIRIQFSSGYGLLFDVLALSFSFPVGMLLMYWLY